MCPRSSEWTAEDRLPMHQLAIPTSLFVYLNKQINTQRTNERMDEISLWTCTVPQALEIGILTKHMELTQFVFGSVDDRLRQLQGKVVQ